LITSPKLATHHLPQVTRDYLKKRREIEGESEEGEKVIWCEEIGKYGGVFICQNGSISYNYHKCGKKNV